MAKHRKVSPTAQKIAALGIAAAVPAVVAMSTATEAQAAEANWDPIIKCESGGDPQAQNASSTASGLFQFIDGTWAAYGGTEYASKAKHATVAEQYEIANRAFAAEGYRPWAASASCHGLSGSGGGSAAPAKKAAPVKKAEPVKATASLDTEKAVKAPKVETYQVLPAVPSNVGFTAGGSGEYVVKLGDTLSSLALEYNTTVGTLVELNKDIIEDPDWIFEGERLQLP